MCTIAFYCCNFRGYWAWKVRVSGLWKDFEMHACTAKVRQDYTGFSCKLVSNPKVEMFLNVVLVASIWWVGFDRCNLYLLCFQLGLCVQILRNLDLIPLESRREDSRGERSHDFLVGSSGHLRLRVLEALVATACEYSLVYTFKSYHAPVELGGKPLNHLAYHPGLCTGDRLAEISKSLDAVWVSLEIIV